MDENGSRPYCHQCYTQATSSSSHVPSSCSKCNLIKCKQSYTQPHLLKRTTATYERDRPLSIRSTEACAKATKQQKLPFWRKSSHFGAHGTCTFCPTQHTPTLPQAALAIVLHWHITTTTRVKEARQHANSPPSTDAVASTGTCHFVPQMAALKPLESVARPSGHACGLSPSTLSRAHGALTLQPNPNPPTCPQSFNPESLCCHLTHHSAPSTPSNQNPPKQPPHSNNHPGPTPTSANNQSLECGGQTSDHLTCGPPTLPV